MPAAIQQIICYFLLVGHEQQHTVLCSVRDYGISSLCQMLPLIWCPLYLQSFEGIVENIVITEVDTRCHLFNVFKKPFLVYTLIELGTMIVLYVL